VVTPPLRIMRGAPVDRGVAVILLGSLAVARSNLLRGVDIALAGVATLRRRTDGVAGSVAEDSTALVRRAPPGGVMSLSPLSE